MKNAVLFCFVFSILGCDGESQTIPTSKLDQAQVVKKTLPRNIHWVRNSVERKGATIGAYGMAAEKVRAHKQSGRAGQPWAVVLDADETTLDNSEHERSNVLDKDPLSLDEWIDSAQATAVPGAVAFTKLVKSFGGRVFIVTNRAETSCDATRKNLKKVGIQFDEVFCQIDEKDKDPRFKAIEKGVGNLPPMEIVVFVGDNADDFPEVTQDLRFEDEDAFADFASGRFVVIPNPMYGSWVKNPQD